jgi:hypothetical protein
MNAPAKGHPVREFLLREALHFVRAASRMAGVRRIALIGSMLTDKPEPKDIDLLVTVEAQCDLAPLAAAGRRLKGRAQGLNRGADIFLADPEGHYIGRTCTWRECAPGIRRACQAQHCGRRHFLNDDLQVVKLSSELILSPVLELWPDNMRREALPRDVEAILVRPFEEQCCAMKEGDA